MGNCRQACPYNTLDGCKVKEYNGTCPLSNSATPITEYRMTNADRIRAMTDEELMKFIEDTGIAGCPYPAMSCRASCQVCILEWLQQPAEVSHD